MPAISIIIPVFEVDHVLLDRCIRSVSSQGSVDAEIIIVDDGSDSDTGALCDEFADDDERIVIIHREHTGVSAARNAGMIAAHGEYIIFVDSDDVLYQGTCEYVINEMNRSHDDILMFQYSVDAARCWDSSDSGVERTRVAVETVHDVMTSIILEDEADPRYCLGAAWGKGFRTEFLRKHGIFFEAKLARMEDRLFMLRCLECGANIGIVPFVGYYYHRNLASTTVRHDSDIEATLAEVAREIEAFNRRCGVFSEDVMNQCRAMLFFKCLHSDILHPRNRVGFCEKLLLIARLARTERYREAIGSVSLRSQSIRKVVAILLLRINSRFLSAA